MNDRGKTVGDVIREASRSAGETAQRGQVVAHPHPQPSAESIVAAHASGGAPNRPIGVIDHLRAATTEANARAAVDSKAARVNVTAAQPTRKAHAGAHVFVNGLCTTCR